MNTATNEQTPWGLLPRSEDALHPLRWLRYYCVEFNPLYLISAVCVLYGVYLLNDHLEEIGLASIEAQRFALFAILQSYELLVIAGAAFLVRRAGAVRPAVLLCFLEAVLLLDCTFRLETHAMEGALGRLLTALWLLLTAFKLWGMARAMRITLTRKHYVALLLTALGTAAMVDWLSTPGADKALALQASGWFGALVLLLLEFKRGALACLLARDEESDDESKERAQRCIRAFHRILIAFYFYHLWAHVLVLGDKSLHGAVAVAHVGMVFLLLALARDKQEDAWVFGGLTVATAAFLPVALPWALGLIGVLYLYRVYRGLHSNLALAAALALYAGACLYGWAGWGKAAPDSLDWYDWRNGALAISLILIGWRLRNKLAWALLAGFAAVLAQQHVSAAQLKGLLPQSDGKRGLLLLGAGFGALLAGLGVNWWFRARPAQAQAVPA